MYGVSHLYEKWFQMLNRKSAIFCVSRKNGRTSIISSMECQYLVFASLQMTFRAENSSQMDISSKFFAVLKKKKKKRTNCLEFLLMCCFLAWINITTIGNLGVPQCNVAMSIRRGLFHSPKASGFQKKNKAGQTNTYLDGIYILLHQFHQIRVHGSS